MVLHSLIREQERLVPAEVEVILLPGLPQIHVLGLPDQVIRESLHRVRSALRTQGFQWPRARQILVNIRPVDRRKSSRGLELAIAAGIVWEMRQRKQPPIKGRVFVYGELTLSGDVREPEDLARDFVPAEGDVVLTGAGRAPIGFPRERIANLAQLDRPTREEARAFTTASVRPPAGLARVFSAEEARALAIAAVGGHHWLLAGAAGAGKSTLARSLASFLAEPPSELLRRGESWRPWIAPHHSTPPLSLLGGGSSPRPGEITRAHEGVLFLDELLEFPRGVQEALREPVEDGEICISRGGQGLTFPCRFQLVATTNLCPCGRWVPGEKAACGRAWRLCRSVLGRVSGPFLDRFDLLTFAKTERSPRDTTGESILALVERAREFRECRGPSTDPWSEVDEPWRTELRQGTSFPSERRRLATLRVARSLADLAGRARIGSDEVGEALVIAWKNFEELSRSDMGV